MQVVAAERIALVKLLSTEPHRLHGKGPCSVDD
jgi:hypothetical protein